MKKYLNNKGYTLIELVVSIAIIAILLSMIAAITNSFYKSYRLSYAENERLEEKNILLLNLKILLKMLIKMLKKLLLKMI